MTGAAALSGADIIMLPGIGGSGEAHWQTLWQQADATMRRFAPSSWDRPELADWCAALTHEVAASCRPPVLVAHSLGCLLVAHWQARSTLPVAGAMLVCAPDPDGPLFPDEARGFADPPRVALRFPALVVASADDPYAGLDYAQAHAQQWGSGFVAAGSCGHINAASGVGAWPHGRELLTAFLADIGRKA